MHNIIADGLIWIDLGYKDIYESNETHYSFEASNFDRFSVQRHIEKQKRNTKLSGLNARMIIWMQKNPTWVD